MNISYISYTQLVTYLRCGRWYQFKYVDKIALPTPSGIVLGRAVHAGIETNYKHKLETGEDLPIDSLLDAYNDSFEETALEVDVWELPKEREKDLGYKLLKAYHPKISKTVKPILVEEEEWINDPELKLNVIVKKDVETEDSIIDIKTISRLPETIPFDYELQLAMYSLYTGKRKVQLHALGKKHLKAKVLHKEFNDEELSSFREVLRQAVRGIRAGVFLPTGVNHKWACAFCEYGKLGLCEFWREK